ncbi:MAG: sodium:proton antiporter [Gammaproteobacteria bacterium]|nr:sodium:proton antiporter [Gammaproteobacteria bacterium]
MIARGRSLLALVALLLTGLVLAAADPEPESLGFWSLVPALATLVICFWTRNVIFGLLCGVLLGGVVSGQYNVIDAFLLPSLGSERYAAILFVYLWALGGLIGMWNKNGGARHFAVAMADRFVSSPRSAKLFAWVMGIIFHQGGTISTVLTGTTVKPVADREKVSHEELSYVVDSTASPIATLIPFNVWPSYIAGLLVISSLAEVVPDEASAIAWFYKAIPFNFYAIFAVLFTFLLSAERMFWMSGKMRAAIERSRTQGLLDRKDAEPLLSRELREPKLPPGYTAHLIDFLLPISVLLGFSIVPWLLGGSPMVFEAFGLSVLSGMALSKARGMSLTDVFDGVLNGIKGVTLGAVLLGLAVTLGNISDQLGAADYVVNNASDLLAFAPYILPGLLMILCMIISFSIGSSWGTYAVVYPIALPLAWAVAPDPFFFTLNFAAVLGGAVFGDQCSPYSDTTVLSAMACGADLMDHVLTQLPLALLAAGLAVLAYVSIAFVHFL